MSADAEEAARADPGDRILALEELRYLGLLDDDEFAVALPSPDAGRPFPQPDPGAGRASLGQVNRPRG